MDENPVDPLAVLRAEIDQMVALAPEVARTARAWFDAFVREDFTEKQALYLAAAEILQSPGTPPA
jgi:hypothetical protein